MQVLIKYLAIKRNKTIFFPLNGLRGRGGGQSIKKISFLTPPLEIREVRESLEVRDVYEVVGVVRECGGETQISCV